jgi:serine phosphatase RsbU (regulator of sigma subunit)
MTLAITVGSSTVVGWIVTLSVTSYETRRADELIASAITHYRHHLEERDRQISLIVRVLLESQTPRSLLREASANHDATSRTNFTDEFLRREVPTELRGTFGMPAFQVIVNEAGELVASSNEPGRPAENFGQVKWPVEETLRSQDNPTTFYAKTPGGMALALGVPLRTEISEPPGDAYFVGYELNDRWFRDQLLADRRMTQSGTAPLSAWFIVDGLVVARASSDAASESLTAFDATTLPRLTARAGAMPGEGNRVQFTSAGERYIGQVFDLALSGAPGAELVLASSQDQALARLRRLQQQILLTTVVACLIAVVACRAIAGMISRPIGELVAGTQRIAAAQFDRPVRVRRRDELGELASSFNQMADGLRERDNLREQRVKLERDMAVARTIQTDVLPKSLPQVEGYQIAAYSLPAEQTGGDIYDVVEVATLDRADQAPAILVLLADAAGHGIGPALSVTQVRSMFRMGVRLHAGLDDVFSQINHQLCQDLANGRFVTAFVGLLDTAQHQIEYHSAGQGPLLCFRRARGEFEWLDTTMLPLGINEDPMSGGLRRLALECGDVLVLLTDGFYECVNASGELLGENRIVEVIRQNHDGSAADLLNQILFTTRDFAGGAEQRDDMTAVVIRRTATA